MASARPNENERGVSYGVTPVGLKEENAAAWSSELLSKIDKVQVQTPRLEEEPSPFSQKDQTTAVLATDEASPVAASTGSAISNTVTSAYTSASTALSNAATALSDATKGSQTATTSTAPTTHVYDQISSAATTGLNTITQVASQAAQTAGQAITSANQSLNTTAADSSAQKTTDTVPGQVRTSQLRAAQPAEASGVPEIVRQKQAVEDELLETVGTSVSGETARPAAQSMETQDILKKIPGGW